VKQKCVRSHLRFSSSESCDNI